MKTYTYSFHYKGKVYNTDKTEKLMEIYDELFNEYKNKKISLLELGVRNGGSILLWNDYFNKCNIAGLDLNKFEFTKDYPNIKAYKGSQTDLELLDKIRQETAPNGFDIIIDDCSHIGELTKKSFWHLFDNHLLKGGFYVIEDWGTGYWGKWPDGHKLKTIEKKNKKSAIDKFLNFLLKISASQKILKSTNWISHYLRVKKIKSHNYGMVGFIKELLDECGIEDITHPEFGIGIPRNSKFESIRIYPQIVFIKKN